MSHLPIYVVLTHIDIVAKMHFFGLADAPVTFLAQNSFGQPSIEDMCKTWTQRFLTDINVTVNGKNFLQRNHPPEQVVNLAMEKKPFCWFQRDNKFCSSQHQ